MMQELYVAGDTWLHRLAAGWKLLVLALAGTLMFGLRSPEPMAIVCLAVALMLWSAGIGWRRFWAQARWLAILTAIVAGFTAWVQGAEAGLVAGLSMASLIGLALAVTFTTTASALVDALATGLRPLHRRGWVDADRVAFTIALTLRFVPELQRRWLAIREAQAARGIRANPVRLVVPMVVAILQAADAIAEAIEARGYPPERGQDRPGAGYPDDDAPERKPRHS
ncbi:MAG: energy-coupling factor transporter transmembrane protein EcfT [Pigmentiphaga sp.]